MRCRPSRATKVNEEGEHLGGSEAAIEAHPQPCSGEGRPQPRQQSRQDPERADPGTGIAGAQHVRKQILIRLLVERQEPGHRQVAPGVVVTVEEGQLLGAVGRVIGRIQIDRDPLGLALQPSAMALDHGLGERDPHPVQIRSIERILEARERRLRCQVLSP